MQGDVPNRQQSHGLRPPAYHLIRLPVYNKKFRLFRRKAYIFSLKFTCLIRTSVNTDNRQFLVSRITNSHISSTPPRFADTVFQSTFYMIEYLCKEPNRNGKWWACCPWLSILSQSCANCRHCTLYKYWQIFFLHLFDFDESARLS